MLSSWAAALKLSCSATARNVRSWCRVRAFSTASVSAIADSRTTIGQVTEPQPTPPAAPDEAEPKLERFRRRRSGVRGHGGGVARGRLEALLDPESLVELDLFASEAVVAGWGAVDGRDVVVYALEPGAAWGEAAGRKIAKAQALALRSRVPIIGIEDDLRPAAEDDLAAAAARADVLARQARSARLVPQLTVAAGGRRRAGPGA